MSECCEYDRRRVLLREAQRGAGAWNGLDYVEGGNQPDELLAVFFGRLPPQLMTADAPRHLRISGGRRIRELRIVRVQAQPAQDADKDDVLLLTVDKVGDFSPYWLELVDLPQIDQRYARAQFYFRRDCPSALDCQPAPAVAAPPAPPPLLDYTARDYPAMRQLLLDRLALNLPGWNEQHAADLGVTLAELLASVADQLAYYQDAVASEAYLHTALQRISVRRHARLVDYRLHEGCHARAWLQLETDADVALDLQQFYFAPDQPGFDVPPAPAPLALQDLPPHWLAQAFSVAWPSGQQTLRRAHNRIVLHDWGGAFCQLRQGSTSCTLRDADQHGKRCLDLAVGDFLALEQVQDRQGMACGAAGLRHVVRLTQVRQNSDPLTPLADGGALPLLEVAWDEADALPFCLPLSAIGPAPACAWLQDLSVARANLILLQHGHVRRQDLGQVPFLHLEQACACVAQAGEVSVQAGAFTPQLDAAPLGWGAPLPLAAPAAAWLAQDVRQALPAIRLQDSLGRSWQARLDLLDSTPHDLHFVVEIDNQGRAQLRFGDGECGWRPEAGLQFEAEYLLGNGVAGNLGVDSVRRLIYRAQAPSGVTLRPRNLTAAVGGSAAEDMQAAKLFAADLAGRPLQRAILAQDYAALAQQHSALQSAAARLAWNGSWYEAQVALDPRGREDCPPALLHAVQQRVLRGRRMGHDLRIKAARYVALDIALEICVQEGYRQADLRPPLQAVFGRAVLADGSLGLFHPDRLSFGQAIHVSQLTALAMAQPGVACATVTKLQRLYCAPNQELARGVLQLGPDEIAQVAQDPDFPEHGQLRLILCGGRA
ncbi:hypothetical protein V8J88_20265 [Massilia sp. W12]|uniref:hypothetical protein n=1 Tax=Massilia sp. W12 TaxID=3126507 RepID=UPI0030CDB41C